MWPGLLSTQDIPGLFCMRAFSFYVLLQLFKFRAAYNQNHFHPDLYFYSHSCPSSILTCTMTTGVFKYIDPSSYDPSATKPFKNPCKKVDGPDSSFKQLDKTRFVENLRGQETQFSVDNSGFAVYSSPPKEKDFTEKSAIMTNYYAEIEALLRAKLSGVKRVVVFDRTI